MKTIKIIIAGGREFNDYDFLDRCMNDIEVMHSANTIEVVSGGARGADELGERWANERGLTLRVKDADWKKHKQQAGIIRNEEMASMAQVLVAFWDGHSTGTKHMIGAAIRNGLEVHIFRYDGSGSLDLLDTGN